ncbi:cadherin-17 [Engraulis encrasicolus]|uniref:cadherin-17 n=1 Tax=Engraulis encrasicolus TaxID=184585 RepID=UPI002FD438B5
MLKLLLLGLLLSFAHGLGLEELKGPLADKELHVPEATAVPYPIYQFVSAVDGVTSYQVSGDLPGIEMSPEGWLYLTQPLVWSEEDTHALQIEAFADGSSVDGPHNIVLKVIDVNNNAPSFLQDVYAGEVMEHTAAGLPFLQVAATDRDDQTTPNAAVKFSIVREIPSTPGTPLFQVNPDTGEISTTEEGSKVLKARDGLMYSQGEERGSREVVEKRFNDYCPVNNVPYEQNPFFTCVLRAESRRVDATSDPDYTLVVRAADMDGAPNALSSTTRVNVVVRQNLWINPGPLTIRENLKEVYPMKIATVTSNDPNAIYSLVQKERNLPFTINPDGEIFVMEELDREQKDMYILVAFAKDEQGVELERPMEIHITVGDENDNAPECGDKEFEVQEIEVIGSTVGNMNAHDPDDEDTPNALLSYKLVAQSPDTGMFSVEAYSGNIQVARAGFKRSVTPEYTLTIAISDGGIPAKTTECQVIVRVIDTNNELPIFEKNDYGQVSVPEDAELPHVLLTIKATDKDDPGTGSSKIDFHIASGDPKGVFAFDTDGNGEGNLYLAKSLDFEDQATYNLVILARNPEPLVPGLGYGDESTAIVTVQVTNVDEPPEFDQDFLVVNAPEDVTVGATLMTVSAHDPEGQELTFKLEGDDGGWLAIDAATGELKTKKALDFEKVNHITAKVVVFEKGAPEMKVEKEVTVHVVDVNDNPPHLKASRAFICANDKKPVLLVAEDKDAEPFAGPFTFSLGFKRSNWELKQVDENSALLSLKKVPIAEQVFGVPVNVKDNGGLGVNNQFDVHVCNCTESGFCFIEPEARSDIFGLEATIGILGGVLGFIIIVFVIAVKQSQKKKSEGEEYAPTKQEEA